MTIRTKDIRGFFSLRRLLPPLSQLPLSRTGRDRSWPSSPWEEDAQVVAVAALLATSASSDNKDNCSNSNLRLSSGINGRQGNFFALVSSSSSSVSMAAVDSNGRRRLTAAGGNDDDSGQRQRAVTMAAVDGGDGRQRRLQQFTPLLIILPSMVALSTASAGF
jgi:hypothetical protein